MDRSRAHQRQRIRCHRDHKGSGDRPERIAQTSIFHRIRSSESTVVIVSSRSLDALAHLTGAPDSIALVGTHGAQSEDATSSDPEANRVVGDLTDTLLRIATSHDGATVEPKPLGTTLHYRQAKDPEAVLAAVDEIAARSGIRMIQGKMVVEFVVGTGSKGSAVDGHRKIITADDVVFFGDDVTDEDVFAVLRAGDIGVKVGPEDSPALYRVGDPMG